MSKGLVRISKTLFAAYTGLTASGYDMADYEDADIKRIIDNIRKAEWSETAVMYFVKARTDRCDVNPYWPLGSMLSTASLRLNEESLEFHDEAAFAESVGNISNISPDEKGPEVLEWLLRLPRMLGMIVRHPGFDALWNDYKGVLEDRSEMYENSLKNVNTSISDTLGIPADELPHFYYIPNLLQVAEMADYETDEDSIGIIQNRPNTTSIIHEALHNILRPYRSKIFNGMEDVPLNMIADIDKMKSTGYAWGDDEESRNNIIEESYVRALSLWAGFRNNKDEADRIASSFSGDGFIMVPELLQYLRSKWNGFMDIAEFVSDFSCSMLQKKAGS